MESTVRYEMYCSHILCIYLSFEFCSQAVVVNETVYLSGQIGMVPEVWNRCLSYTVPRIESDIPSLPPSPLSHPLSPSLHQTGEFASTDPAEQAKQALTNLGNVLQAAGSSFKNGIATPRKYNNMYVV